MMDKIAIALATATIALSSSALSAAPTSGQGHKFEHPVLGPIKSPTPISGHSKGSMSRTARGQYQPNRYDRIPRYRAKRHDR